MTADAMPSNREETVGATLDDARAAAALRCQERRVVQAHRESSAAAWCDRALQSGTNCNAMSLSRVCVGIMGGNK